jgi:uncharacterized protein
MGRGGKHLAPQLANCPKCRKLFIRIKDICEDCYQIQEADYLKVADYLREHVKSTIQELSKETNVTITQIRQFIVSQRLILSHFPNLMYPCDSCGNMIREGKSCISCMVTLEQLAIRIENGQEEKTQNRKKSVGAYKSRI